MELNLMDFIRPELLVMIPVLYGIGMMIKNNKSIADTSIPVILGLLGIALTGLWVFANTNMTTPREIAMGVFTSIVQGILCASASVFVNQLKVQHIKAVENNAATTKAENGENMN